MGKKPIKESSLEIPNQNDKNKLNTLIKVLKPKVYITDSSSFKNLVQQLTGNGTSPVAPPLPPPPLPRADEDVIVAATDYSKESSGCSSSDVCNLQQHASFMGESISTPAVEPYSEEKAFFPATGFDNFPVNRDYVLGFDDQEMESWLLQSFDPFPWPVWSDDNGYYYHSFEAPCMDDYDLTGLISPLRG